jgi:hypothetical protein
MTKEQQHIFEYLKEVLTDNWDNLSNYAKTRNNDYKHYDNVEELINDIQSDLSLMNWYFTEGLKTHIRNVNLLDELIIYEDDEHSVYLINDKFIKVCFNYENEPQYRFAPNFVLKTLFTVLKQFLK